MLLAIDVGNTNILAGVYLDGALRETWRARTERDRTADEHALLFDGMLRMRGLSFANVDGVAVSNVVPPLAPALRQFCRKYLGHEAEFLGETLKPRIPVRYTPAAAVGADRLADAVAVLCRYGAPAMVVDFGTATTYDAISAAGEYLGGAIAPGAGICMEALFRTAAHLPRIEVARPEQVIGRSTVESMQSGAYYGFVAQVEGMVRRFREALGPETQVIATGGLAELICADLACVDHVEPNLTLEGLHLLWQERHAGAA